MTSLADDFWPPIEGTDPNGSNYIQVFSVTTTTPIGSSAPVWGGWKNRYVTFQVDGATTLVKAASYSTAAISYGTTTATAAAGRIPANGEASWRWRQEDYVSMSTTTGTALVTVWVSSGK
jgi:hypothetical protein